jgi:hypothetical protein
VHVRLGPLGLGVLILRRSMSHRHNREGPRQENFDDTDPSGRMDTEGGGAHLADVLANNALKEIIQQAKETVSLEEGPFRIPSYVMDRLVIRCEKVLLNYGEEEAQKCMVEEIRAHLAQMKEFKAHENERKVKERLPSSSEDPEVQANHPPLKARPQRRR